MKTGFGWIEIRGTRYEHDIIIHRSGEIERRKKKVSKPLRSYYGHTPLSEDELWFLGDEQPAVVYVGTGQDGALPLTPEAGKILESYEAVIAPTPQVLPLLENEDRPHVAILHLTC